MTTLIKENVVDLTENKQFSQEANVEALIHGETLQVENRKILFPLLGFGKPTAGKPMSGDVIVELCNKRNPIFFPTNTILIKIDMWYFNREGDKVNLRFHVPKLPNDIFDIINWIDQLLEIQDYDDGIENINGFTKEVHKEFIERLKNASLNPRYQQRFRAALELIQWGIK